MQNIFGKYPEYPSAWDPNLNYEQNLARENREPGALSTYSENCSSEVWEPEPPKEAELQVPVVKGRRFSKSVYPKWYRSIINGEGGPDGPGPETSAHISPRYSRPGINDIVCKTKITSPLIEDCVHAFGRMNEKPDRDANKGKNGSWHWEGVSLVQRLSSCCYLFVISRNTDVILNCSFSAFQKLRSWCELYRRLVKLHGSRGRYSRTCDAYIRSMPGGGR